MKNTIVVIIKLSLKIGISIVLMKIPSITPDAIVIIAVQIFIKKRIIIVCVI